MTLAVRYSPGTKTNAINLFHAVKVLNLTHLQIYYNLLSFILWITQ